MTGAPSGWREELKARLAAAWVGKMLATTLGISAFFIAYFWVLRNPQDALVTVPLTPLDLLIPVDPRALPLYFSLWVYVSIAPALLRNGSELVRFGLGTLVLSAIGLVIFLVWPTTTPDFGIDWSHYPSMAFLKTVDVSANACPSLHVAFAVFTGIWLDRLLREIGLGMTVRTVNLLWCLGILYSTLAVRQHVLLDVLAGAALGALVALVHLETCRAPAGGANASRFGARARRTVDARFLARARSLSATDPGVSAAAPSPKGRAAGPARRG